MLFDSVAADLLPKFRIMLWDMIECLLITTGYRVVMILLWEIVLDLIQFERLFVFDAGDRAGTDVVC